MDALLVFLSSVMAAITKHVAVTMHPLEMVFFRNLFAVTALLPWALTYGIPHIKAANFRLYFSRSLSSLFAMSMFFYSISIIPLTDAIALTFTVPLITTMFAANIPEGKSRKPQMAGPCDRIFRSFSYFAPRA